MLSSWNLRDLFSLGVMETLSTESFEEGMLHLIVGNTEEVKTVSTIPRILEPMSVDLANAPRARRGLGRVPFVMHASITNSYVIAQSPPACQAYSNVQRRRQSKIELAA